MQENKTLQVLKWSVILLVICNIGLLLTLWLKPEHSFRHFHELPPPHEQAPPRGDLISTLRLTSEQNRKFEDMLFENEHKIDSLKQLTITTRATFFDCLKKGNTSTQVVDSLSTALGDLHKQIELQTYSHFAGIREMLTDSQKTVFDSMIGSVLKSLPEQPHVRGDSAERHHPMLGPPPPPDGNLYPHERRGPPPPRDGHQLDHYRYDPPPAPDGRQVSHDGETNPPPPPPPR